MKPRIFLFHKVEPQTWLKQITGTTRSGMILRDVCFEVHSGEIMAILGSKGKNSWECVLHNDKHDPLRVQKHFF